MIAWLKLHADAVLKLDGDRPFQIGRDPIACQLMMRGDGQISRVHARILFVEGKPYVEDAGSKNGTLLNGRHLESRQRLTTGDTVTIGGVDLIFLKTDEVNAIATPVQPTARFAIPHAGAPDGADDDLEEDEEGDSSDGGLHSDPHSPL